EDFHVVARIQDARRDVEQLERGVHAHAHVGGEHDGDLLGRHFDGGAAVVVEAGGADDHAGAVAHAGLQVGGGGFGAGEVDQAVGVGQRVEPVGDGHPRIAAQEGAGILPERRGAAAVERDGQFQVGGVEHGFDQHAAHTAAGAGNGDAHGGSSV